MYRYTQGDGNLQIRICDVDGSELQIFDTYIEQQMNNQKQGSSATRNIKDIYIDELNNKYNETAKQPYLFGAPWSGQGSNCTLERINAYIYSTSMKSFPDVVYTENGNHKGLKSFFSSRFEESYIEYRNKGEVYVDEYGEEIDITEPGTKIVITYKLK